MDTLPEYFPYRDDGCEVSSRCLRCPLPQCRYDSDASGNRNWLQRERRAQRDNRVLQVRRKERATVVELARRFNISQRTVHRILAQASNGHQDHAQDGLSPSSDSQWRPIPSNL